MPEWNIQRYSRPAEDTVFPLEYAFHLLGQLRGKTVIELGCDQGLNSVILARLGAQVLCIDASNDNLRMTEQRAHANGVGARVKPVHFNGSISVHDAEADLVLCTSGFYLGDPIVAARQIRRVLRPGGRAVFEMPLALPDLVSAIRDCSHDAENRGAGRCALTVQEIKAVSRAVGAAGRGRQFWLTTPVVCGNGISTFSALAKWTQRLDAALLKHVPATRRFAYAFVWEAKKEC